MSTAHRFGPAQTSGAVSSEILDRQPPSNLEAEHGVLGSIMLLPSVCDEVALILRPEDFYDDANRTLYDHMLAMHDGGQKIDMTLLVERLRTSDDLEKIGGPAYLEKTFHSVPNAAHARYYAEIVRAKPQEYKKWIKMKPASPQMGVLQAYAKALDSKLELETALGGVGLLQKAEEQEVKRPWFPPPS